AAREFALRRRGADVDDDVVAVAVLLDVVPGNARLDRLADVTALGNDQGGVRPAREVAVSIAGSLARLNQLAERGRRSAASARGGRAVQAEVARHEVIGRLAGRAMRQRGPRRAQRAIALLDDPLLALDDQPSPTGGDEIQLLAVAVVVLGRGPTDGDRRLGQALVLRRRRQPPRPLPDLGPVEGDEGRYLCVGAHV